MYQHTENLDDLHFCEKTVCINNDESHFLNLAIMLGIQNP